ncbi:MAG: Uma2 family endonuclease [Acidobacteria bacterium]|nr:Uma2 family endonuclease [Acidobacteriota bacterium]
MSAVPKRKYTLEEYFDLERKSDARLEYWDGEIFDMSGVDPDHDQIESNLHLRLRLQLEGKPCRVYLANTRIMVPSLPPYRYGDLSALCGEAQYEKIGGIRTLVNPQLIIEVLSDSTEAYDRGDKFSYYKSIPSFCEYLLIAQHRPHVTHYLKQADGRWLQTEYNQLADVVQLVSLDCALTLQEIYEQVRFGETPPHPHLRPLA